ncbi:DUF362 domain-containing protein [Methanobacterium sp.]|uniref:DUF362 domain-containing protein n=1 Tax=Methanobacterium sp. TaxID=2164 RepID=UPI0025EB0D8C|nr:DUF362 domain-containing protein [Methanobacterium sp.]MBI5460419.1 DUF362 domain-containing protein [Methanobacterium sp.]
MAKDGYSKVFLAKNADRISGIKKVLQYFELDTFRGKNVALKANFNSGDPFPASTHPETLKSLIDCLGKSGTGRITLIERSGMGNTRDVLEKLGIFKLSQEMGFEVVVLDEEERDSWVKIEKHGTHWLKGFYIPRIICDADMVVQTCCLKTHSFGGHFTLSLKNSVGLVAKKLPGSIYDYMAELHISPYQRSMIAEINNYYPVDLVLMDAMKIFVDGGPAKGTIAEPGLILASSDRVALDAVGVAILRYHGTTKAVSKGKIFELNQIHRAAELEVGISSPEEIELVPLDEESQELTPDLETILKN